MNKFQRFLLFATLITTYYWRGSVQLVEGRQFLFNSEINKTTEQYSSQTSVNQSEKNKELEEAKRLFNDGQFQKAIELLKRLVITKSLPKRDHLEASEYLAVAFVSNNQDKEAEEIFSQILQQDPNYKPNDQWWPHQRLMANYYKTRQKAGLSLKVSTQGPSVQTIAIMDFENNSIDDVEKYENLGNALAKILISDFAVVSNLRVVERERIQFLIQELELTEKKVGGKNIMDPEYAPQLGKFLGAHSFVFGSFIRLGKKFRIDARLVKTETGEIFKTASVEGKPDKIFELVKKLTLNITKNLDIDIKKVERKKLDELGKDEIPIEAVALFGDAMSMANLEQYKEAFNKLEEALVVAPNFQKAKDMMIAIRPLVL
ncbi:MAG: CsgG/HfaB family protein [bacterium]